LQHCATPVRLPPFACPAYFSIKTRALDEEGINRITSPWGLLPPSPTRLGPTALHLRWPSIVTFMRAPPTTCVLSTRILNRLLRQKLSVLDSGFLPPWPVGLRSCLPVEPRFRVLPFWHPPVHCGFSRPSFPVSPPLDVGWPWLCDPKVSPRLLFLPSFGAVVAAACTSVLGPPLPCSTTPTIPFLAVAPPNIFPVPSPSPGLPLLHRALPVVTFSLVSPLLWQAACCPLLHPQFLCPHFHPPLPPLPLAPSSLPLPASPTSSG